MPYAGDLQPAEAYGLLQRDERAVLVDVRTRAEWSYVGIPDLRPVGHDVVLIEWQTFPGNAANPAFLEQLRSSVGTDVPVAFICRSGVRSRAAAEAATAAGYSQAYNVSGGFEGPLDASGHRGSEAGWKAAGLPWRQS